MASIGGLSSNAGVGGASTLRGVGGLASGLDRDTLIENMTAATRSKIAKQKQKKQTISWTQQALQNITSKMYQFSDKYTSYASSSNLISSKLFSRNLITTVGENSKYITATGTSTSADALSILGVKQLAKDAQMITNTQASDQALKTGAMSADIGDSFTVNTIEGDSLYLSIGNKDYMITLSEVKDMDFRTEDGAEYAKKAINEALAKVSIGGGQKLSDNVEADVTGGQLVLKSKTDNNVKLTGGTGNVLQELGFLRSGEKFEDLGDDRKVISTAGLTAPEATNIKENSTYAKELSGKKIRFDYNGKTAWITLGKYTSGTPTPSWATVQEDIQTKLNTAFGKDRIKVDLTSDSLGKKQLSFATKNPSTGASDGSSTLSVSAAEKGVLGKYGLFNMEEGESNRLNLTSGISKSGLNGANTMGAGTYGLKINDKLFTFKADTTLNDIMKKINSSDAGVTISYQANSDKFVVKSNDPGGSGEVKLETASTDADGNPVQDGLSVLFGAPTDYTITGGKDAEVWVQYGGSSEKVLVNRGSNTFTIDGMNITVKNEFGVDASGNPVAGEEVTFDAQVDVDTTTKTVKEMIDAYNEVLKLIADEVKQKPDRDYSPLTDEQKADMSEDQIKQWETEAKKGLLFNDTDLRGLADSLRFILPTDDRAALSKMGITVSTNYADNGKLVFDETAFKAALGSDPEAVKDVFTREASVNADGTKSDAGLMVKMKDVMDQYARTTGSTKGILIERAGSVYAPTSVLKNAMKDQMDEIDKYIKQLNTKLKTEQDRYISQFTSLETLISQMNSQSSYLSSAFGA